jgi:hypothetical protein
MGGPWGLRPETAAADAAGAGDLRLGLATAATARGRERAARPGVRSHLTLAAALLARSVASDRTGSAEFERVVAKNRRSRADGR